MSSQPNQISRPLPAPAVLAVLCMLAALPPAALAGVPEGPMILESAVHRDHDRREAPRAERIVRRTPASSMHRPGPRDSISAASPPAGQTTLRMPASITIRAPGPSDRPASGAAGLDESLIDLPPPSKS